MQFTATLTKGAHIEVEDQLRHRTCEAGRLIKSVRCTWLVFSRQLGWHCLLVLGCLTIVPVRGDQLPSHAYTIQDGLPLNRLNDSRHIFTRPEFLFTISRVHMAGDDPRPLSFPARAQAERSTTPTSGIYVVRLTRPKTVSTLFEDHRKRIWCGTIDGLFILDPLEKDPRLTKIDVFPARGEDSTISAITEDSSGVIWASFLAKLYRIEDGVKPQGFSSRRLSNHISALLRDTRGRIWVGSWGGLHLLRSAPDGASIIERTWKERDGLSSRVIQNLSDRRTAECGLPPNAA